ncbi:uncharacterized protein BXZ73DRAFT_54255 [Epithele typhae]|uniref:uncharacterized protein n=1 Tax=Epithele typhae TaxID=378194 RepID=UPI0020080618|nr:uncharacterized protein BXZ73DRAFT_54255 [Epithele typhae]KAH9915597.1 hypothetical protein BXZ73DRAFT_54255 [Epithele typhae]
MTYDIMCIYIRNLLKRMEKNFPAVVPIIKKMYCCLPAFHAHGHRDMCKTVYSLALSYGFGFQHGEQVERPWIKMNFAGPATSEMTAGNRHDKLNMTFNFWNLCQRQKQREQYLRIGACLG